MVGGGERCGTEKGFGEGERRRGSHGFDRGREWLVGVGGVRRGGDNRVF